MLKKAIRPVALLIAEKNNKILAISTHDFKKDEGFYRLIGGGIEFGESGAEALKREVKEEVGAEIKNIKYLGLIENVFNYEGRNMHEIALIYRAEFKNKEIYKKNEIEILDSRYPQKAVWLEKNIAFKKKLYPEKLKKFIK